MYRIHFYNNFIDEEFKKRQQICFYFHCEIHCYSNKNCLPMTTLHIEVGTCIQCIIFPYPFLLIFYILINAPTTKYKYPIF